MRRTIDLRAVRFFCRILAVVLSAGMAQPRAMAAETGTQAVRVAAAIDALDVEHHWPAGVHVHWETGIPDGKPESGVGKHTHCSAFVAAAAKQLGIYLLRPPEHAQVLLANAQYDWLAREGERQGWSPISDGASAQQRANLGFLVIATYKNHHDDKPGHIAIVRPSDKSAALIRAEGPQVTQAGGSNYRSTSLKQGFAGHPDAWAKNQVRYYAHAVPIEVAHAQMHVPSTLRSRE